MKIQKGFTLIELMIVVAIGGILAAIAIPAIKGEKVKDYKCVAGYAFTYQGTQIMNEAGKGVPCSNGVSSPATPNISPGTGAR